MKTIDVAKFKEQCLPLLDHLDPDGLVVTKHGKPVARVLPCERRFVPRIGTLRNKIRIHGDTLNTGS